MLKERVKLIAKCIAAGAAIYLAGTINGVWLTLSHGDLIGSPIMLLGAKLVSAADPAIVQKFDTLAPLPGELDTPKPPIVVREATKRSPETKLARK